LNLPSLDPEHQREFAVEVVRKLRGRGFEAFWAGGCVRDRILGHTPKDYDVATTATPEEIRQIFGTRRTVAVGAAFGVIAVVGPKTAGHVEVATFRQDAPYSDGRRPDSVEFSTPEADARRRDFTINGLFYDPLDNRVIDYVGGQDDLAKRVLRAIGDPHARFVEDKLRLLRAVRIAAAFGLTLDPATRDAVRTMAPQITIVSAERIAAEMRLMLVHENRARAVMLLREMGLLNAILPELTAANEPEMLIASGRPDDEAWSTALKVLEGLIKPHFPLALAALLHLFVDSAGAAEICRRWKLSNHESHDTCWLVKNQSALTGARQMAWPKLQRMLISAQIDELLALQQARAQATGTDTADFEYCRELLKMAPEQLNPAPLVTGDDLIVHGVPRGKQYQRLLEAVRDAQLEKRILTKQEALALVDELQQMGS
jgi:poly(A) polymerase